MFMSDQEEEISVQNTGTVANQKNCHSLVKCRYNLVLIMLFLSKDNFNQRSRKVFSRNLKIKFDNSAKKSETEK